jgi:hypothetical protein
MHEVNLKLTSQQYRKIMNDIPIKVKHSQIGNGIHSLHLHDHNYHKLEKAFGRKGSCTLHLHPEEKEHIIHAGSIGSWFRKVGKTLKNKVINPIVKGTRIIARPVASTLIHVGIPIAGSALGSTLGVASGNPALAPIGGAFGKFAGNDLSKYIGQKTGYGLKPKPRVRVIQTKPQAEDEFTYSSMQNINSPAMNPYVPSVSPYLTPVPLGIHAGKGLIGGGIGGGILGPGHKIGVSGRRRIPLGPGAINPMPMPVAVPLPTEDGNGLTRKMVKKMILTHKRKGKGLF